MVHATPTPNLPNRVMHLPDGEYQLRTLGPNDRRNLQDFFKSHTAETVYQRYGHPVKVMTDDDADRLVGVDQSRDLALTLIEIKDNKDIIHAVGRYCLNPVGKSAEVAFVVRESKRQLGFTTCLMQEMIRVAKDRKLFSLWASVLPSNHPMRKALEKFAFREIERDNDEIIFELKLR